MRYQAILLWAALSALAMPTANAGTEIDVQNGLKICLRLAKDANPGDARRAEADFKQCFAGLKPYLEPGFVPANAGRR